MLCSFTFLLQISMNVSYPTRITVVCMPTAPIPLEVMSVPAQKALQEMELHVMVGVGKYDMILYP